MNLQFVERWIPINDINEYNSIFETNDRREIIKQKPRQYYDGRIVRKNLIKSILECQTKQVYAFFIS